MRDAFKKGLSFGLGLAITSKEQAEKMIDELVKRGELTQQESKQFINDIWKKGEASQTELDEKIHKKLNQLLDELNVATKDEVNALEKRINQLEKQQNKPE